jgi:hypothetical protein
MLTFAGKRANNYNYRNKKMKYMTILPVSVLMVTSAAFSQVPGRGLPQIDPLMAILLLLAPFFIIFIMAVALLFIARWVFKARHKESMNVLQQIEQHLAFKANAPSGLDASSEVSVTEPSDNKDESTGTQA